MNLAAAQVTITFLDEPDHHGAAAPMCEVLLDRDQSQRRVLATVRDGTTERSPEPITSYWTDFGAAPFQPLRDCVTTDVVGRQSPTA
jgi:hypothetical protein